jgi:hypothetical protein
MVRSSPITAACRPSPSVARLALRRAARCRVRRPTLAPLLCQGPASAAGRVRRRLVGVNVVRPVGRSTLTPSGASALCGNCRGRAFKTDLVGG